MTATATMADSDTWTKQLEQLKGRYKHVRPPILAALNILLHNANISLDDAKAQAQVHGVRITAASMNAAKTLLSRMDSAPAAKSPAGANTAAAQTSPTTAAQARVRRPRAAQPALDAETLIRGVVAKLQGQGNAEAERLRDGIRKAIGVLQSLVGS